MQLEHLRIGESLKIVEKLDKIALLWKINKWP